MSEYRVLASPEAGSPVESAKRCCRCKQVKPLTSYYRFHLAKDGRVGRCKACWNLPVETPEASEQMVSALREKGVMRERQWGENPGEVESPHWRLIGLCQFSDGDWFTIGSKQLSGQRKDKQKELAICQACPVQSECLDFGLGQPFGIWGGLLPRERAAERRRRREST